MEEQLRNRLSLRRFVGLTLVDDTRDETSVVKFRGGLRATLHQRTLFDVVGAHLDELGLILKTGILEPIRVVGKKAIAKALPRAAAQRFGLRTVRGGLKLETQLQLWGGVGQRGIAATESERGRS